MNDGRMTLSGIITDYNECEMFRKYVLLCSRRWDELR